MTELSLDQLRRSAKRLRRDHQQGVARALERLRIHPPRSDAGTDGQALRHADYLHVVAREQNFTSWPVLKLAAETMGLDRAGRQQRLKLALANGQGAVVQHLLAQTPDLADGLLGCAIALYDVDAVRAALAADASAAVRPLGARSPMVHLCFSKMIHVWPDRRDAMLEIAQLLIDSGADVNDALAGPDGHGVSVLYGALGHANNMVLAQWLLDHGADPNDGESLYHATELGHTQGLEMLLRAGADPKGTNALLRALDFNDHAAVRLLLEAGADVNEFAGGPVGGEVPWVIPALHQAARRMCDREMVDILLAAGADVAAQYQGASAYGYARVYGNQALAAAIEAQGDAYLSAVEQALVAAAEGRVSGAQIDPAALPEAYQNLLHALIPLDRSLDHLRALIALGLPVDAVDDQGLTPLQIAAWEGLPEAMALFIDQGADLDHVNGYGGTLLSTILHGAQHCPARAKRAHIRCLELALSQGIDLPQQALDWPGDPAVTEFLLDWAGQHPDQVVAGGLA